MGHLTLIRGHLHVLDDGRDQFRPLTLVETGRGRRSTGRQLGRFLKMMGVAAGVAPATVASTRGALLPVAAAQARAAMAARVGEKST
jgi:hypothetical protein